MMQKAGFLENKMHCHLTQHIDVNSFIDQCFSTCFLSWRPLKYHTYLEAPHSKMKKKI